MSVPHSPDAEQALVNRLLLDPKLIPLVSGSLDPDDMYVTGLRQAYRMMVNLTAEGKSVDIVTLGDAGIGVDILELSSGHHGPVESYVEIIKRKALDRRVLAVVDRIADAVDSGDENIIVTIQSAVSELMRDEQVDSRNAINEWSDWLDKRRTGETGLDWSAIPGMDAVVNPATAGKVILVASLPSIGKTALAESIVDHWASKGPVLFCSLEMSRIDLLDRAAARWSGVSAKKIIRGELNDTEYTEVKEAINRFKLLPIEYRDSPRTTTAQVRTAAARVKMQSDGLVAVVVDYLQLLADPGEDEVQRLGRISRELKAIAREFQVPLLAMAQFNRAADNPSGGRLTDLLGSGALERDADVVVALNGKRGTGMRKVTILKERQGGAGQFNVWFDGEHCRWQAPMPSFSWSASETMEREPVTEW